MNKELVTLIGLAKARGATDTEIARVTGYSSAYIYSLRRAAGIPSGARTPVDGGERIRLIIERLQAGETLQEIGDSIGITRQRVEQLAIKGGASGNIGRIKRRELSEESFARKRDERYRGTYGCTYGEVIALNEGLPLAHHDSRAKGYRFWVRNVLDVMCSTGTLNFPQWCAVWGDRWKDRGRGAAYRLSRIDRTKSFTPDNVICERGNESISRHRKTNPWGNTAGHA